MAFLGSIGKFFQHAVHNPIVQAAFPVFAVGNVLASSGIQHLLDATHSHPAGAAHPLAEPGPSQYYAQPLGQQAPYYVQPSGSYFSPEQTINPYDQFSGGQPSWAYSTPSPTYLIPAQAGTRDSSTISWEDLAAGALFL